MKASAALSPFRFEGRRRDEPPTLRSVTGADEPSSGSRPGTDKTLAGSDPNVRVLVYFENHYRAYREVIAGAIRALRPQAEVAVAASGTLEAEIARFKPHLVISSSRDDAGREAPLAWIELPYDPDRPATLRMEGRPPEAASPTLDGLLSVVDAVDALARTSRKARNPRAGHRAG